MTIQHSDQLELPFNTAGYASVTWIDFKYMVTYHPITDMINSFYWDSTPQGFDYWLEVHDLLCDYVREGNVRFAGRNSMGANILQAFSFTGTMAGWDYWQRVVSNLTEVEVALNEKYPGKTWYKHETA